MFSSSVEGHRFNTGRVKLKTMKLVFAATLLSRQQKEVRTKTGCHSKFLSNSYCFNECSACNLTSIVLPKKQFIQIVQPIVEFIMLTISIICQQAKPKSKQTFIVKSNPEIDSRFMKFLPNYLWLFCFCMISVLL